MPFSKAPRSSPLPSPTRSAGGSSVLMGSVLLGSVLLGSVLLGSVLMGSVLAGTMLAKARVRHVICRA
ncbi:hypothetical protein E3T55_15280 [Cryobacterium frigoriphilum]|uniref:Uncharacterized protein n=1 Tax=Cryobacterium frigoriphilum TaxID=1259150 RepID=A0A4R8ZVP9_9MICO|nr:hypothetical protein [Cryobacterium frigoriphilum]TFD47339.1 hypothetical protein E3T55_15280 [Cryobacterium frigoriphilum]